VFDKAAQEAWINDDDTSLVLGERANVTAATATQNTRFTRLEKHPDFKAIIQFLADYVEKAIPRPHLTERRFWSVTAYPSTGSPYGRRVAVISINNVEVFMCLENDRKSSNELFWLINVDPSIRLPTMTMLASSISNDYASVGRVRQLFGDKSPFESPQVAYAARSLAMGLLRKGQGMMARYHNPLLADAIFAELERRSKLR